MGNNILIGKYVCINILEGDENIIIGVGSAVSLVRGSRNIIIGSGIDVQNKECNGYVNIGGIEMDMSESDNGAFRLFLTNTVHEALGSIDFHEAEQAGKDE